MPSYPLWIMLVNLTVDLHPILPFFFFLNDTPPPEIYPLSLHDALPISISTTFVRRFTFPFPSRTISSPAPVATRISSPLPAATSEAAPSRVYFRFAELRGKSVSYEIGRAHV